MALHSSALAWKIPWTEEAGRLQSMGLWRVRHDWATWLSLFTFLHWRRKWQPTPVFLPGESQGRGSLVGCHLWGHTVGHDWTDLAVVPENKHAETLVNIVIYFHFARYTSLLCRIISKQQNLSAGCHTYGLISTVVSDSSSVSELSPFS